MSENKLESTFLRRAFTNKEGKVWFEFYKQPCYVCGKTGNCLINEDGKTVACTRVASDKLFSKKNTSYLHLMEDGKEISYHKTNANKIREKMDNYLLDFAYRNMLDNCSLTKEHVQHFNVERGLSSETVEARKYRSYSVDTLTMAKSLLGPLYNQENFKSSNVGIPGAYTNVNNEWEMVKHNGILIPYRNHHNEIVGFQIRNTEVMNYASADPTHFEGLYVRVKTQPNLVQVSCDGEVLSEFEMKVGETVKFEYEDKHTEIKLEKGQRYIWLSSPKKKNGTPAATQDSPLPVHVALPVEELLEFEDKMKTSDSLLTYKCDSIWVTEGALKADIAVDHLSKAFKSNVEIGTTMLAVPGVNSWRAILPVLKEMEVKRVNIAFDMDVTTNPQVANHYIEMVKELGDLGYEVYIALWKTVHKGIDDLLTAKMLPQLFKKY